MGDLFYWRYGKYGARPIPRTAIVGEVIARRCKSPADGWSVTFHLTYTAKSGEIKTASLCKVNTKRGKPRIFRTLDNLARQLRIHGVSDFKVDISHVDEVVSNDSI